MHMHSEIAALRRDPTSQRRRQIAMETARQDWLESDVAIHIQRDFARFADGEPLADLPALARLISDRSAASLYVDAFVRAFIEIYQREPLGEMPFRQNASEGFARLQLMQANSAMLSLNVYEPVAVTDDHETAQFHDCELNEIVIAGSGRARIHRRGHCSNKEIKIVSTAHDWHPGSVNILRRNRDARDVLFVDQSLLILQLSRTPSSPLPSFEYRLSDGTLLQQASGDKRASQQLMALSVLGALEHSDAIDPIDTFARNSDQDRDARWEGIRQLLALDSARGFALLTVIAERDEDQLAKPARDLRDQLLTAHPALRQFEREIA